MGKFTEYIGSQCGNPRGIIGACCCLIMNAMNRAMYRRVLATVKLNKDSQLLDIGYGNGYLIKGIFKKFRCYISGIDISEDMKQIATKRNREADERGKLNLKVGDCCDLPFDNNSFQVVTSVNTIYFWKDTLKGLSEIYRVLSEDGYFVNALYSKEWLQKLSYTRKGFAFFDKDELIALGKKAGFKEVLVEDIVGGKSYIVIFKK